MCAILSDDRINQLQACVSDLQKIVFDIGFQRTCLSLGQQTMENSMSEFSKLDETGLLDNIDDDVYDALQNMAIQESRLWYGKSEVSVDYESAIKRLLELTIQLQHCILYMGRLNELSSDLEELHSCAGDWRDGVLELLNNAEISNCDEDDDLDSDAVCDDFLS